MNKQKSFLGSGWSFPPEFSDASHQNKMVSNEKDVQQSLLILLGTSPGERVMHPLFGCGINKLVYEPVSNALFAKIKNLIENAILLFESRVQLNDIHIEYNPKVEGVVFISLDYTIRAVNTRQNLVYPFYLIEGTNIEGIE